MMENSVECVMFKGTGEQMFNTANNLLHETHTNTCAVCKNKDDESEYIILTWDRHTHIGDLLSDTNYLGHLLAQTLDYAYTDLVDKVNKAREEGVIPTLEKTIDDTEFMLKDVEIPTKISLHCYGTLQVAPEEK